MIYTTCLSDHFAHRLVDLVFEKYQDPLVLSQVQIILPTRRACRIVKESFLKKSAHTPILLPKLIPLYELQNIMEDIPNSCTALQRLLLLSKLCLEKKVAVSEDQALKAAMGLAELLDEFYQFEIDFNRLSTLIPQENFARHWHLTLDFLSVIMHEWPRILGERGEIDPMERTIRMIDHYARMIEINPPKTPIILGGFDSLLPSVIRLCKTLKDKCNTLIIFDGFNSEMPSLTFNTLPESHPQYGKVNLLKKMNIAPQSVKNISPMREMKEALIMQSMMPDFAASPDNARPKLTPNVLSNVHRIECATPEKEALAIALILRGVLETPGKTASLVTSDRTLSRRVILEMKRWGVDLDDSAGNPLFHTPQGIYFDLIAQHCVMRTGKSLLSVLKHPLANDGQDPIAFKTYLENAEKRARENHTKLDVSCQTDFTGLCRLFTQNDPVSLDVLLKEHMAIALALNKSHLSEKEELWQGDAGAAAFEFFTQLMQSAPLYGPISPHLYPRILKLLMMHTPVRTAGRTHPRLSILGPIESRLFHTDVCVFGGLNEGVFPNTADTNPFLNRNMRASLGLPLDAKLSNNAADFAHAFCANEIYLTRAVKEKGAPTIASRFLSRIEALLQSNGIEWQKETAALADLIERPGNRVQIASPAPMPPVSTRPRRLSATKIELWMRNPYAVYARYILKLFPLDPLEKTPKKLLWGNTVHEILERFFTGTNAKTKENLMALGRSVFAEKEFTPADTAFYFPKFENIADFIIQYESERDGLVKCTLTEETGTLVLKRPGGDFKINAKADRIDVMRGGTCEIIDYKTGSVPSAKEVWAGYAPQLPIEGLIAAAKGFENVPVQTVQNLTYLKLSGRENASAASSPLSKTGDDLNALLLKTKQGIETLIDTFDDAKTPYYVTPTPAQAPAYDDYAHLARSKEWQSEGQ